MRPNMGIAHLSTLQQLDRYLNLKEHSNFEFWHVTQNCWLLHTQNTQSNQSQCGPPPVALTTARCRDSKDSIDAFDADDYNTNRKGRVNSESQAQHGSSDSRRTIQETETISRSP